MKVHVDQELCQGHGRCYALAPELFEPDDLGNGFAIDEGDVPAELEAKAPQLPDDVVWHFVGTVQRRKLGIIRARAALVHSFDRMALVAPWGGAGAPPVLVQVNLAAEPQKHGADRAAVASVVDAAEEAGIRCQGLMVMPPLAADAALMAMFVPAAVEASPETTSTRGRRSVPSTSPSIEPR